MANLVPRKGLADLIEAAARVPDPRGELVVAIAGDGPERTALENLAAVRLRGRAVFLGPVLGDTADVYAAADVFALTSYREGLPLVYLESAFHGVPCIGTDVGGTSEVVRDGRTGVLVQPGDPAAVAVAIQRLRDDPALRSRLGDAARAHAHAELTESVMADRYEQLFASSH
jgi:glycosyltransferase involved in cell wall biosynthesis